MEAARCLVKHKRRMVWSWKAMGYWRWWGKVLDHVGLKLPTPRDRRDWCFMEFLRRVLRSRNFKTPNSQLTRQSPWGVDKEIVELLLRDYVGEQPLVPLFLCFHGVFRLKCKPARWLLRSELWDILHRYCPALKLGDWTQLKPCKTCENWGICDLRTCGIDELVKVLEKDIEDTMSFWWSLKS